MNILQMIYIIALSIIVTQWISPLEWFKWEYGIKPEMTKYYILKFIYKVLNCSLCFSFWFTFYGFGFTWAIVVAFLTEIVNRNFTKIKL